MATTLSVIHAPIYERAASRVSMVASAWRTRLVQAICALNGHERYRHLTANRVCLRCLLCGHETRGWTLSPAGPPHDRPVARPHASRVTSITARRRPA